MTTATEALTIRRATAADEAHLVALRFSVGWEVQSVKGQLDAAARGQRAILLAEIGGMSAGDEDHLRWAMRMLEEGTESPESEAALKAAKAIPLRQVVGAITVEWDDPNRPDLADPDQYIAHVNDRAVKPEYQRRGIGSRLMQAAEDLARERGLYMLMAQVPESLPHVREEVLDRGYVYLYERDGFTVYRLALR